MTTERIYCQRIIDMSYDYDWDGLVEILRDDLDTYASVCYIVLLAHGEIVPEVDAEIEIAKIDADPERAIALLHLTQGLQHEYLRGLPMNVTYELGESVEVASRILEA